MKEKINDKIAQIENYLKILSEIIPSNVEEYKSNYEKKWSCEKGFENIIEAITDLAFLLIREMKLKKPEDDLNALKILLNNDIISNELYEKLKQAKGMRNIIAHEYGEIDDNLVFDAISSEIERDAEEFISSVRKVLSEENIK